MANSVLFEEQYAKIIETNHSTLVRVVYEGNLYCTNSSVKKVQQHR